MSETNKQNQGVMQIAPQCKHLRNIRDQQLIPTLDKIQKAARQLEEIKRQKYAQQNNIQEQNVTMQQLDTVRLCCSYKDSKNGQCQYCEEDMWICLHCFQIFGGNQHCLHAQAHFDQTKHVLAMNLYGCGIWCFKCNQFVNTQSLLLDLQKIFLQHQTLSQWSTQEVAKQEKIQQQVIQQQKTQNIIQKNSNQQQVEQLCSQLSEQYGQYIGKYNITDTGKISFNKATCYAVAVIHMLAHIDCFSNYFITFWAENNDYTDQAIYQFTSVLQKYILYVKSPQQHQTLIESNELAYAINQLNLQHFQAGSQQDANEFLQILFEHLTYRCRQHANVCFLLPQNNLQSAQSSPYIIYIPSPQKAQEFANKIFKTSNTIPNALIFVIHQQNLNQNDEIPKEIEVKPSKFQNFELESFESSFTKQQLINQYYINIMADGLSNNIVSSIFKSMGIRIDDYYYPRIVKYLKYIFISIQNNATEMLTKLIPEVGSAKYKFVSEDLLEIVSFLLIQEFIQHAHNNIKNNTQQQNKILDEFITKWEKNDTNNYYYNFDDFDVKMFQSFKFVFKSGVYYNGTGQAGHYISRVGDSYINGNNIQSSSQGFQPYIFAMERQNYSNLYNQFLYVIENQNALYQSMYKPMCNAYITLINKDKIQYIVSYKKYYKCPALLLYYLCQLKYIPQCDYRNLITDYELVKYSLQPFQECGFIKINGFTLMYLQAIAQYQIQLDEYEEEDTSVQQKTKLLDSILQNKYKTQQSLEHSQYILSMQFVNDMIKEIMLKYQIQHKPANYDLFADRLCQMENLRQDIYEYKDYISITQEQEYQLEKYYEVYPIEKVIAFQDNDSDQTVEGSMVTSSQDI